MATLAKILLKTGLTSGIEHGSRRLVPADGWHQSMSPWALINRTKVTNGGGYNSVTSTVYYVWMLKFQKLFLKEDQEQENTVLGTMWFNSCRWNNTCVPHEVKVPNMDMMTSEQQKCYHEILAFYKKHGYMNVFIHGKPGCGKSTMAV